MGLLDDLKQQAQQQHSTGSEGGANGDDFFRDQIKPRMVASFKYLSDLVTTLNSMSLETRVDYPFKPDGQPLTLRQQDYKIYSDDIPEPRQITFTCYCSLLAPTAYEIQGRGAEIAQSALLDRYHFKYDKQMQRDSRQQEIGAKFRLQGPLVVKLRLQFDESRGVIKLLVSNLSGPGTSQHNLKPEQLDDAFLDRLGNFILRKESALFKEEVSDDVKAMLRKKLQEEQQLREAELQQAEEIRKAQEAARRQNSTTEQLQNAVSHSVARNTEKMKQTMNEQLGDKTEKLKTLFGKIRSQISPKKF
jgi:hypothetical protein